MKFPQLKDKILSAITNYMDISNEDVRKTVYVNIRQITKESDIHHLLLPVLIAKYIKIVENGENKIFFMTLNSFLNHYPNEAFLEIIKVASSCENSQLVKMNHLLKKFELDHPNVISTNEEINSAFLNFSEKVINLNFYFYAINLSFFNHNFLNLLNKYFLRLYLEKMLKL